MKIAILMLIHEYTEQQKKLIQHLSKDFDIYIHIDKRSKIDIKKITLLNKNIYVFSKYKVYWGSYNQIISTLYLFNIAFNNDYDRFIFISGSCLPIKSNNYITSFFTKTNSEFLEFEKLPRSCWNGNGGFDRLDYFYSNSLSKGNDNLFFKCLTKIQNKINNLLIIPIMKHLNIKRNHKGIIFYGGANWMDLTKSCVAQIIDFTKNNKWFINRFKYTRCADEIFFQTIICNYVKNIQLENRLLRYVDWNSGPEYPKVLREEDYIKLKQSECLFARKFNSKIDNTVINKIFKDL